MAFKTKVPPPPGKPASKTEEKPSSDPGKASSPANIKTTFGIPNSI